MSKLVRVVQVDWMDIVNERKIDYENSMTLQEALKQERENREQEKIAEENKRKEIEELRLQHQLEELQKAYIRKDWQSCLELIVERMGGIVMPPDYN